MAEKKQHQAIKNLTAVLEAAGTNINNVVKVNVFIDDMANFAAMNEVRKRDKYLQTPSPFSLLSLSLSLMIRKKNRSTPPTGAKTNPAGHAWQPSSFPWEQMWRLNVLRCFRKLHVPNKEDRGRDTFRVSNLSCKISSSSS